jgi:hypothetical protein
MLLAVLLLTFLGSYRFAPERNIDAPPEPLELPHPA